MQLPGTQTGKHEILGSVPELQKETRADEARRLGRRKTRRGGNLKQIRNKSLSGGGARGLLLA